MHQYLLYLLAGSILGYFALDAILVRPARFHIYYTVFCLMSAGLLALYVAGMV